jgi:hypothetical protein
VHNHASEYVIDFGGCFRIVQRRSANSSPQAPAWTVEADESSKAKTSSPTGVIYEWKFCLQFCTERTVSLFDLTTLSGNVLRYGKPDIRPQTFSARRCKSH